VKSFLKDMLTKVFTAQMQRIISKHKPTIVAVAGSVGKTTTKLAIATVLSKGLRVRYQEGNYNTFLTVPLIFTGQNMPSLYNPFAWVKVWLNGQKVLKHAYPYDVVVVELGVDVPGDMAIFKKSLRPDIAVITAVCEEHMEFFKTLDAVAKEELLLTTFSDKIVLGQEDIDKDYLGKYVPKDTRAITYGLESGDYKVKPIQKESGFFIDSKTSKGEIRNALVDNLVPTSLKSVAAAIAVADLLGLNNKQIVAGVKAVKPMAGRMQILKGLKNSIIIDDTYNSSPLAAESALDTLYELSGKPGMQRIAILGSMNELGEYSKEAHERVGKYCDASKIYLLITIGEQANKYLAPMAEQKGIRVMKCASPYQAADAVIMDLQNDATILAKGSQNGVFAEEAVKLILADKNDTKKLVRQNDFWIKIKRAQFKDYK
jgi:UDP-N-acetylmuramoyl-tripeptide--D-alanyl-D-alanine ligase